MILVGQSRHRRNYAALFNSDIAEGWLTTAALKNMPVLLIFLVLERLPTISVIHCVAVVRMVVSDNDSSCGADFIKFELEDGELLEASSFIPVSIKSKADVRPRKWTPEDLMSTADGGFARIIGWGSFGERRERAFARFSVFRRNWPPFEGCPYVAAKNNPSTKDELLGCCGV